MKWVMILATLIATSSSVYAETKTKLETGDAGDVTFPSAAAQTPYATIQKNSVQYSDTISGTLTFPASAQGKVPAIILMHGSGGINASVYAWAEYYRAQGYATFVVDSFRERGIINTIADQSQLQYGATVVDGVAALNLLATHPAIDANRIGITGFSRGGVAALYSSYESLVKNLSTHRFAFHIPFYPGCSYTAKTAGKPILVLMGDEDSYFSAEKCRTQELQLKTAGADVKLIVYPGAAHGFDVASASRKYYSKAVNWRACDFEANFDTQQIVLKDQGNKVVTEPELATYLNSCSKYGIDYGYDPAAYAQSKQDIAAFLTKVR